MKDEGGTERVIPRQLIVCQVREVIEAQCILMFMLVCCVMRLGMMARARTGQQEMTAERQAGFGRRSRYAMLRILNLIPWEMRSLRARAEF